MSKIKKIIIVLTYIKRKYKSTITPYPGPWSTCYSNNISINIYWREQ